VVVVAAKFLQMGGSFAALVRAVASMPDVRLVVKPHPAETADPYRQAAAGVAGVVVAPPTANLASLIGVARALVTVNSTAAIEAMPLGVPSLIVGLPNNLSPFVDAGVMAGAPTDEDIPVVLRRLLCDQSVRQQLFERSATFMDEQGIRADGGSAGRAAGVIERLIVDSRWS
jgi:CDP-glycerol glycerophosphotransferase (TagB/SpsB family)